jgi:SAM-dependent methyltransferase
MDHRELMLLRAARETGVLDALATSADTPAEVAEATGVTERAARITVAALAEMGLLERVGEAYEPTNRMLGFLASADVRSVGSLPHRLDCLERWIALPETMRTGEPPDPPADWTTHFVGAMATVDEATVRASVTAAVHEHPDATRVLDVGGGPGSFAREFASRGFEVTLFDRPEVVERVRPHLSPEPVELVEGDALDGLPSEFDLAFCSRLAHGFAPDENRRLLRNVRDALVPGGTVVLTDHVRGRSDEAAIFAAHMLAQTPAGDTYTEGQFESWLTAAGFVEPRIPDIPGTEMQAIAADTPGAGE